MTDFSPVEQSKSGNTVPKEPVNPPEQPVIPVPITNQNAASLVDSLISQTTPPVQSPQTKPTTDGGNQPKKRSSFGIMLAGVLLLMITLPIGIYFVAQQNTRLTEQRSCAADGDCGGGGPYANETAPPGPCNEQWCCHQYKDRTCFWQLNGRTGCLCTGTTCNSWGAWGACHKDTCKCIKERYCSDGSNSTYQIASCDEETCTPCDSPTQPPNHTITITPTTLPGQCTRIRVYKNGVSIDPNTLSVGDVVQLACAGTNAEKARIRVNGGGWGETSVKNDEGEYFISYTIPAGVASFTIESEIFTNNEWK